MTAIAAARVASKASARQNKRVPPPALNTARATQKLTTPSTKVANAIAVAAGFTDNVTHDGAVCVSGVKLMVLLDFGRVRRKCRDHSHR